MSDQGERTCPLCAEEMDLTDKQLKPCKCGYEICVWCWHHIMDMAEKDDTEGRCPACRSPYDKEKIVGMAASCERLVSESTERKKSQKSKGKSSDGRKQLSSVRVIQRNLVYIVGLPLNLADEDLLQHKEYFGQYGKVLKVSMSRTAAGVIQQFPNNTCSVYITYGKEEEAVRCIQSVHGYVLDGRPLKACFGTTKYCHAWLRNVPCTNPDCLYLHDVGSQEDSFTKDEIISAYTRVQQITGATNNVQRHSGNVLPPPIDDYCISSVSTAKPIVKTTANPPAMVSKSSPPNGSSSKPIALPAAASWGMRASSQPAVPGFASPTEPSKQKSGAGSGTLAFASVVSNTSKVRPLPSDAIKKATSSEDGQPMRAQSAYNSLKEQRNQTISLENLVLPEEYPKSNHTPYSSDTKYNESANSDAHNVSNSFGPSRQPCKSVNLEEENPEAETHVQNICANISSMSLDMNGRSGSSGALESSSDYGLVKSPANEDLLQQYASQYTESSSSPTDTKPAPSVNRASFMEAESKWKVANPQRQVVENENADLEEDILSFDSQRLNDPEVVNRSVYSPPNTSNFLHVPSHTRPFPLQQNDVLSPINSSFDLQFRDGKGNDGSMFLNGYPERAVGGYFGADVNADHSFLLRSEGKQKQRGRLFGDTNGNASIDTGESSIISNMLSLDCDTWDGSLTSPQNLAKLLGETDKQTSSKLSNSWKAQNNNQSRFSFARQEESNKQASDVEAYRVFGQFSGQHSFSQDFAGNTPSAYVDRFGTGNGFSSNGFEGSGSPAVFSSSKHSVSRAQISAPPGFSVPSRSPPPGFPSHERLDQTFDTSGNRFFDSSSSLLRNTHLAPSGGSAGVCGDIEFMDPAILAVGTRRLQGGVNNSGLDMRSNYPQQLSALENEARLQLLMQRSLSPHQNLRFSNFGDNFSSNGDSYGMTSRLIDQSQGNNLSPFAQLSYQQQRNPLPSNGNWDSWNELQGGNNMRMTEILRNERLGYNKFYNGYEESKFQMPSSGDLYNRTYGM